MNLDGLIPSDNDIPIMPNISETDALLDEDWLSKTFLVTSDDLEEPDLKNQYFSTASLKFTDTRLGGNIGINSRPQFTRFADIRVKGRNTSRNDVTVSSTGGNYGMGRFYSQYIDDPKQTLYLQFGIQEPNNLVSFFSRSVDYASSVVVNSGRSTIAYNAAYILGAAAIFVAFPVASVAIYGIKAIADLMSNNEVFSYYYFKNTMHDYWSTVNTLVNMFAVELGFLIPTFTKSAKDASRMGIPITLDQEDIDYMRNLVPDLISENNYIDVFAIANRAQKIANKHILLEKKMFDEGKLSNIDFEGYIKTPMSVNEFNSPGSGFTNTLNEIFSLNRSPSDDSSIQTINTYEEYLDAIKSKSGAAYGPRDPFVPQTDEQESLELEGKSTSTYENEDGTIDKVLSENDNSWFEAMTANIDSSARGGGEYAAFVVEYLGSVSESFSNEVTDIPTSGILKSITNKTMSIQYSLAGANIIPGGKELIGYAKDLVMGKLEGLTMGLSNIIPSLLGGGYIDIGKMWNDSTYSFPSHTFKMSLVPPYGHPISRLQNVYIPLAMIMAGALPRSTGKASYGSPFLCNLFLKGVQKISKGMITSLNITRGTTNQGFDDNNQAIGYEIEFTVTDFSSIMAVPTNNGLFSGFKLAFDDGTLLSNYISTMTARDLMINKYSMPRAKIKLSRALFEIDAALSPANMGMRAGQAMTGVLGSFTSYMNLNLMDANNRF